MDLKLFATVFASVFAAELGDKTQLATLLFAAQGANPRLTVFMGAASALVVTSAIGVLAGGVVADHLRPAVVSRLAGAGFVAIGAWMLWRG
jgi:putative Ca2+/H+ antiporter (TMEM165/GDT1 family)